MLFNIKIKDPGFKLMNLWLKLMIWWLLSKYDYEIQCRKI